MAFKCNITSLQEGLKVGGKEVYVKEEVNHIIFWAQDSGVCINEYKLMKGKLESYKPDGKVRVWNIMVINDFLKSTKPDQVIDVDYKKGQVVIGMLSPLNLIMRSLEIGLIDQNAGLGTEVKNSMSMPKLDYENIPNFRASSVEFINMLQHIALMKGKEKNSIKLFMDSDKVSTSDIRDNYKVEETIKIATNKGGESSVSINKTYLPRLFSIGKVEGTTCQCWIHKDKPFVFKIVHTEFEYTFLVAPMHDDKPQS